MRGDSLTGVIRVAVLDDHPAVLDALERLVQSADDLTAVGFVADPQQLWSCLQTAQADVVVLDHDLLRADGLTVCQRLKDRPRSPKVLLYSAHTGPGLVLAAHVARADGLVDKSEPVAVLLAAIRQVAAGNRVLPAVSMELQRTTLGRLRAEDLAVAAMLLAGSSPREIAHALCFDHREAAHRARRVLAGVRPQPSLSGAGAR